jgi:hypothetical protein
MSRYKGRQSAKAICSTCSDLLATRASLLMSLISLFIGKNSLFYDAGNLAESF